MVIVTLGANGNIIGYEAATLSTYRRQFHSDPTKVFVDRSLFLNDTDVGHFLNYPQKYSVTAGSLRRTEL